MNAIQALALNTCMQDLMLNHLLLLVLDSETHKEWKFHTATQQDIPTMSTVIDFLEARCKALELLQANQSTSSTTSQQSPQVRIKVSQSSRCNLANQEQCPLCKGTHRLYQCSNFTRMPPWQRYDYAQQTRACYNCLQPYSQSHICSTHACHVCNKRHHTLLHVKTQDTSASNEGFITSPSVTNGTTGQTLQTHRVTNSTTMEQLACSHMAPCARTTYKRRRNKP